VSKSYTVVMLRGVPRSYSAKAPQFGMPAIATPLEWFTVYWRISHAVHMPARG
jgi:hypothetical protein